MRACEDTEEANKACDPIIPQMILTKSECEERGKMRHGRSEIDEASFFHMWWGYEDRLNSEGTRPEHEIGLSQFYFQIGQALEEREGAGELERESTHMPIG